VLARILNEQINDDGSRDLTVEMDKKHLGLLKAVKTAELD
jgi:hypothetical protein